MLLRHTVRGLQQPLLPSAWVRCTHPSHRRCCARCMRRFGRPGSSSACSPRSSPQPRSGSARSENGGGWTSSTCFTRTGELVGRDEKRCRSAMGRRGGARLLGTRSAACSERRSALPRRRVLLESGSGIPDQEGGSQMARPTTAGGRLARFVAELEWTSVPRRSGPWSVTTCWTRSAASSPRSEARAGRRR